MHPKFTQSNTFIVSNCVLFPKKFLNQEYQFLLQTRTGRCSSAFLWRRRCFPVHRASSNVATAAASPWTRCATSSTTAATAVTSRDSVHVSNKHFLFHEYWSNKNARVFFHELTRRLWRIGQTSPEKFRGNSKSSYLRIELYSDRASFRNARGVAKFDRWNLEWLLRGTGEWWYK